MRGGDGRDEPSVELCDGGLFDAKDYVCGVEGRVDLCTSL